MARPYRSRSDRTRTSLKVAIHRNDRIFRHSTSWSYPWEDYCRSHHVDYDIVDGFRPDALEILYRYDAFLWHVSNYSLPEMLFARSILQAAKNLGLSVFPDFETSWHFDDKIGESYLLGSVDAPTPRHWIFYTFKDCEAWLETSCPFPVVAKLRSGSGSENVKLINNRKDATAYARRMFGKGLDATPNVLFKARTQWDSSKDWATVARRLRRIPDLIQKQKNAKAFSPEKGYVFFQEYVPNGGFDIKVVVVGDKLSYIGRRARKKDFRASGSGDLFFDREIVSKDIFDAAFQTSDRARFQCMGYDFVVDRRDGRGKILEISFGFSHLALLQAGGYWDRESIWHDDPLNAPYEVMDRIVCDRTGRDQFLKNPSGCDQG